MGGSEHDVPWQDLHGDGHWIRCDRIGPNQFKWFVAFRSGESYETKQPSSIRTHTATNQVVFPDAVNGAFFDIETGMGRLAFNADPFDTRETDILHFPHHAPAPVDTERVPHVLRLVENSRPVPRKKRFFRRFAANDFQGFDPWLDFEIDGRFLVSWLETRGAEQPIVGNSCETFLQAGQGDGAGRQLDCLAGLRAHDLGRDPWLLGCPCGDPGCGGLTVRITRARGRVMWSDFAYSWCYGDDDYFGSYLPMAGESVFDEAQYDAEIADARNRSP